MTTYENAPATIMLATHCACCGRPLVDAESVTAGIGPHCRDKHGVPDTLDEETRTRANKLVHAIAREDVSAKELVAATVELALLGCDKLAARCAKRAGRIQITLTSEAELEVRAPYSDGFRFGRWDREAKCRRVHPADAKRLLAELRANYGVLVMRVDTDGAEDFYDLHGPGAEWWAGLVEACAPAKPAEPAPSTAKVAKIYVERAAGRIMAKTPYSPGFVAAVKSISGRRWHANVKGWSVPDTKRAALWDAMKAHYAGAEIVVDGEDRGTI